jgi:glycosyltransferase involved in cell wall biosynthesis
MTKKLKILHAAVSMNPSSGVVKQMEWEQNAAQVLDIDWVSALHTVIESKSPIVTTWQDLSRYTLLRYIQLKAKFYAWLELVSDDFDLILLRYSVHDPWQWRLAGKIGHKLLTVHHTKEEPELRGAKCSAGWVKVMLERYFGCSTLRNVLGQVAVTPEVLAYEKGRLKKLKKPGFVYPNGIEMQPRSFLDHRSADVPEIVFVASRFSHWHGLDKIIHALKMDDSNCVLHIVGRVSDEDVAECKLDSRILLHGHLDAEHLNYLMSKAWCGLSSFALERQEMKQACTLKVREYLEAGLPVYAGHVDSGLPMNFIFFKNADPKLRNILAFATAMRSYSREEVSLSASPYIVKSALLSALYQQLAEGFPSFLNSPIYYDRALR